ncbi:MAG: sulfonate transport system substrate-binding protein [Bacteroidia bacterium]|jgi:sulfonate transport system substrate-binding protein
MKAIRVGGVPEHFNYPWHYGIQAGIFDAYGLTIDWTDVQGGSGAMCKMLENDELDIALVLTEGIVKHLHNGGTSKIVQQYVKSPLIWGVHSKSGENFGVADFTKARFARSRVGSGSHLMSYVHAEQKGYDISEENFVTVGNIDGAMVAFEQNEADILLWEKFMTQPYVAQGKLNRIGQCVSPWPCFMLVASKKFLDANSETVQALCTSILQSCEQVTLREDTVSQIANRYNLKKESVAKWYDTVEWQTSPWLSKKMLQNVINTLERVDLLNTTSLSPENLCSPESRLY